MEALFEVMLVLAQQPLVVVERDHLFGEPPLGEPCLKGVQLLYYHGGFQKLGRYGGLAVLDHPCEPDLLLLGKKEHRAHLLEIGPNRVMDGAWTDLFGALLREVGDDIGIHPGVIDIELRFLFLSLLFGKVLYIFRIAGHRTHPRTFSLIWKAPCPSSA